MKKVRSEVDRRDSEVKRNWKELGRFLSHILTGAVLMICLVILEAMVVFAVRWITGLVAEAWFTAAMDGLERALLWVDVALSLWWVVRSAWKALKEKDDE